MDKSSNPNQKVAEESKTEQQPYGQQPQAELMPKILKIKKAVIGKQIDLQGDHPKMPKMPQVLSQIKIK